MCVCVCVCYPDSKCNDNNYYLKHHVDFDCLKHCSSPDHYQSTKKAKHYFEELQRGTVGMSIYYYDVFLIENQRRTIYNYETHYLSREITCKSGFSYCDHLSNECFANEGKCIFMRDLYGNSKYCSGTQHLKFCLKHECPGRFKCPQSYCIGLHMVCDTIADCPDKDDELNCHAVHASGLFKCKHENIYVSLTHVCDGLTDCLYSFDDEAACESFNCPNGCICISYTVYCVHLHILSQIPLNTRSFYVANIQDISGTVQNSKHLLSIVVINSTLNIRLEDFIGKHSELLKLVLLNISNEISLKQKPFRYLTKVVHFNIQHNKLRHIQSHSFKGLNSLNTLNIDGLFIQFIHADGFHGLEALRLLNLSHNLIRMLEHSTFNQLKKLETLDISSNIINELDGVLVFYKSVTVHVHEQSVCCYVSQCVYKIRYKYVGLCSPLLYSNTIAHLFLIGVVCICVINSIQISTQLNLKRRNALSLLNIEMCINDLITCFILCIMASLHFSMYNLFTLKMKFLSQTSEIFVIRMLIILAFLMPSIFATLLSSLYYRVTVYAIEKKAFTIRQMIAKSGIFLLAIIVLGAMWANNTIDNIYCFGFPLGYTFASNKVTYIVNSTLVLIKLVCCAFCVMVNYNIACFVENNTKELHFSNKPKNRSRRLYFFIILHTLETILNCILIITHLTFYKSQVLFVSYLIHNVAVSSLHFLNFYKKK